MPTKKPIQSVRTSFDIIDALVELDGATVSELTDYMDMPKSTVHDYLRTLNEENYILKNGDSYRPSFEFLNLGGQLRRENELFTTARPELQSLAQKTGEHASVIVEENGHGVVLHTESGGTMEAAVVHIGARAYLHTTAPGKAILAAMSLEERESILERHGLPPVTENTITNREDFEAQLEEIQQQDFAIDREEVLAGMRGLGTTIMNQEDGAVVGAISLYGPTSGTEIEELVEGLLQTANIIEVNLTYS